MLYVLLLENILWHMCRKRKLANHSDATYLGLYLIDVDIIFKVITYLYILSNNILFLIFHTYLQIQELTTLLVGIYLDHSIYKYLCLF